MNALTHAGAWNLDEHRLDPLANVRGKLRFSLRYAVLAPSSHNTQPWHFIMDGDCVTLCADRLRRSFSSASRRGCRRCRCSLH
jgi:hypothetical protein